MTAPDTYTPFGWLPYTAPDPVEATVLRDAAPLCYPIRLQGRR